MSKTLFAFLMVATLRADDVDTRLAQPLLNPKQPMVEAQIYLASRVKPVPTFSTRAEWEKYAVDVRRQVLDNVMFRGEAAKWRTIPVKEEWLDTIQGDGYKLKKFRYQILPGLWLPGLLYEPNELKGHMPVVINVNG